MPPRPALSPPGLGTPPAASCRWRRHPGLSWRRGRGSGRRAQTGRCGKAAQDPRRLRAGPSSPSLRRPPWGRDLVSPARRPSDSGGSDGATETPGRRQALRLDGTSRAARGVGECHSSGPRSCPRAGASPPENGGRLSPHGRVRSPPRSTRLPLSDFIGLSAGRQTLACAALSTPPRAPRADRTPPLLPLAVRAGRRRPHRVTRPRTRVAVFLDLRKTGTADMGQPPRPPAFAW